MVGPPSYFGAIIVKFFGVQTERCCQRLGFKSLSEMRPSHLVSHTFILHNDLAILKEMLYSRVPTPVWNIKGLGKTHECLQHSSTCYYDYHYDDNAGRGEDHRHRRGRHHHRRRHQPPTATTATTATTTTSTGTTPAILNTAGYTPSPPRKPEAPTCCSTKASETGASLVVFN